MQTKRDFILTIIATGVGVAVVLFFSFVFADKLYRYWRGQQALSQVPSVDYDLLQPIANSPDTGESLKTSLYGQLAPAPVANGDTSAPPQASSLQGQVTDLVNQTLNQVNQTLTSVTDAVLPQALPTVTLPTVQLPSVPDLPVISKPLLP